MRIGFDAKRAFQNTTGLGNYSRDVIRLFTNNYPNSQFFLFDPKGQGIHFEYNLFNTQIISSQRNSSIGKSIWRQYGLKREIENLHLDIYHGLSNELPVGIEKSKVKTVVTIHDLIFERHPEWYPKFDRNIYRKKVKRATKIATEVVAISEQTKNDLIEIYNVEPEKITVIYQGCNPAFSVKQSPESIHDHLKSFHLPEKYLLYVGTIEPRKNLLSVVKALADTDITLVAVGRKTDYFKKIESALEGTTLKNNFRHLGDLTQLQLVALYQQARLFVYPSLYEGFGIPIIEALHSGTPVITGFGCLQEAAGKGGVFVDVTNTEALKNAILTTWENDALLENLSVAGLEHVKKFSDAAIWENWKYLYDSI